MITGHDCINAYLCRIGWSPSPNFVHFGFPSTYEKVLDDPLLILYDCEAFEKERDLFIRKIKKHNPEYIVT